MCGRAGTLLAFVPTDKFELLSGQDQLTDYQFHHHNIHHLFCKTCGIKPFARGKSPQGGEMIAVNLRCVEGVDVFAAAGRARQFDGKSM